MKIITEQLKDSAATLTAYLHDKSRELVNAAIRPAVLVFPGGGYQFCSDREAEPIALAYAAEGYNAFVLRYTVGTDTPFQLAFQDTQAAMERLHAQAKVWNINPEKIAVIGFSAGGHLAAMLGTTGNIRPSALMLCYPCITSDIGELLARELPSAEKCVDEKTPPTFIFSTRDDRVVPIRHSLAFAEALDRGGIPFEMHIFCNGAHGLSLAKPHTSSGLRSMNEPRISKWFGLSVEWLKCQWGDFVAEYDMPMFDIKMEELCVDAPLAILLEVEDCKAILTAEIPELLALAEDNDLMKQASLRIIASHAPELLPQNLLIAIDEELRRVITE